MTIQPAELRVLKVSGGMIPDSQAGYLPENSEINIDGKELKQRIYGFGSN